MLKLILLIFLLSLPVLSVSQTVPKNSFYGGLGGSFAIVDFSEVDANTLGLSNIFISGTSVTTGHADGPYTFPASSTNKFGPNLQAGYFQKFNKSNWLWGSKITYTYIGSSTTSSEIDIPQYGSNSAGNSFEGVAVVQSFQYSMNHQFTLIPYIGISTSKTFFYLGAGVSLSETKEEINGVVGYAFVGSNSDTVNISGDPTNFSSTNWVWGFAAAAGGTYFFNPGLFLDLSFIFNPTQNQTNNFTAPFSHTKGPIMTSGELVGRTSAKETTYSISLTVNKTF